MNVKGIPPVPHNCSGPEVEGREWDGEEEVPCPGPRVEESRRGAEGRRREVPCPGQGKGAKG